ncbi:hypothetical protein J5W52_02115 [Akkermansia muciniphila]|uniref:hypothetical protein n=1 Tax=Akkermansia muciniphila TaxID=239935 RepID=UPI001C06247A|nr:hypothetical protein [Akkermansia muciniphila]QWP56487.1 hypothetical protein J5W52_02115 [Akkermansia muciniphila]
MTAKVPERLEWSGKNGAEERFFCMTAEPGASFEEELRSLMARYRNLGAGKKRNSCCVSMSATRCASRLRCGG